MHSWGNCVVSLQMACKDIDGYSSEKPCPDESHQDSLLKTNALKLFLIQDRNCNTVTRVSCMKRSSSKLFPCLPVDKNDLFGS